MFCVLGQDTLLSKCLSQQRSIKGTGEFNDHGILKSESIKNSQSCIGETIIVARFSLRDLEAASTVPVFYPARSVTVCDQIHVEFEYSENSIVLF